MSAAIRAAALVSVWERDPAASDRVNVRRARKGGRVKWFASP
jgi:hypothetical protein